MDTALIIHPVLKGSARVRSQDDAIEEIIGLAQAIHLDILETRTVNLSRITPATYIGKGAAEEIAERVKDLKPTVAIFDGTLSPGQQRNLEKALNVKLIDRTSLILEIFGARAQTREGKIQVDLAFWEYQKSRLVRLWTHLERQRGGGGFLGGPGEKQMELDRRRIDERVLSLKKELEQVRKTRELGRKARERVPFPIVALVGYTNAGKSTLFNRITGAEVFAQDMLFATLDPTLRRIKLPSGQDIILSDTVGFISDLPTTLIAAFRATLEQVQYADIILHVRDISSPDHVAQRQDVIDVLAELGIDYAQDERVIEVLNKIDIATQADANEYLRQSKTDDNITTISAVTGQGIEDLLTRIAHKLAATRKELLYRLPVSDGQAQSWLHRHAEVLKTEYEETDILLKVRLSEADQGKFKTHFGYQAA